jgi:hypothetical protein
MASRIADDLRINQRLSLFLSWAAKGPVENFICVEQRAGVRSPEIIRQGNDGILYTYHATYKGQRMGIP